MILRPGKATGQGKTSTTNCYPNWLARSVHSLPERDVLTLVHPCTVVAGRTVLSVALSSHRDQPHARTVYRLPFTVHRLLYISIVDPGPLPS